MSTVKFIPMTAACAALAVGAAAMAQSRDQDRPRDPDRDRVTQPDTIKHEHMERLSRILKMSVQTQDNQNAGEIRDVGINPDNGRAVFVIINPQGEGASNLKAAPFGALRFTGESQARLNITKARFNDAPPFDDAGWGERGGGTNWAEIVYKHYGLTFDKDLHHTTRALVRGTELLNTNVRNQEKQELGSIEDVILDTRQGVVLFALIEPQERTGAADQGVVVPFNALASVNTQQRLAVLNIDRARLAQAPMFRNMEDLAEQRLERVYAFYGTQREQDRNRDGVYGYTPPEREGAGGWQHRGDYGQHFKASTIETVQGEVVAVDRFTPMQDMMHGVRLTLRSGNDQNIIVHLGPAWYVDRQYLRFDNGDNVRVTGSRVQMDGQRVIMATEVRRGDEVLLLRDRDGLPRWDATYRVSDLPRGSSTITPERNPNRDRDNDRSPGRNRDRDD